MGILVETSAMIRDQDGALMSMSLKPEKKGPLLLRQTCIQLNRAGTQKLTIRF